MIIPKDSFMFELTKPLVLVFILYFQSSYLFADSAQVTQSQFARDSLAQASGEPNKNQSKRSGNDDKRDQDVVTPRDRDPGDPDAHSNNQSTKQSDGEEQINPNTPSSGINDATTESKNSSSK